MVASMRNGTFGKHTLVPNLRWKELDGNACKGLHYVCTRCRKMGRPDVFKERGNRQLVCDPKWTLPKYCVDKYETRAARSTPTQAAIIRELMVWQQRKDSPGQSPSSGSQQRDMPAWSQ